MEMRKLILFLLIPLAQFSFAQTPLDIGSVELLIDKHKKQYDLLQRRNGEEIKHNSVSTIVKDISEKYEKLHKELTAKYNLADGWINVGINAVGILTELKDLSAVIPSFLAQAKHIKRLTILEKYLRAGKELSEEIKLCTELSKRIVILRLDAKELYDLSMEIKERLYAMKYIIKKYTWLIEGQVDFDRLVRPSLPDRMKIARDIIKNMNKKEP